MPLTLHAAVDRPLIEAGTLSERYLMLTLGTPAGTTQRLPLNLALIIDASGSMAGTKLARVKEAVAFALRHLTSADRAALIAYDDEVTIVAPSMLLTAEAKVDLLARLNRIESGGTTNLGGGWLTGCQEVARHQAGERQMDRAVVLTDGLANAGITSPEELVEHARQLRLRGIVTLTMGVGADFNEDLLEAIARHGGGRFQYVETARHIPDCMQGELGEMLQVALRKVAVEVTLPEGVRCLTCLNEYMIEETRSGVRLHLGDLLAGDTRHVVLKIAMDAGQATFPLRIDTLALYVDMATGRGAEQRCGAVELRDADVALVASQTADDDVVREVALLLAARAKEDAVRLSRLGNHAAAAGVLAHASLSLSASPSAASPMVAGEIDMLARLASEAGEGLAEHQRKELRYQSYLAREARQRYDLPSS